MDQPIDSIHKALEQVKRFSKNGGEYWMGRDIQPILGYATWDKFLNVISRAMMASESSGQEPGKHFYQTGKMIAIGHGGQREKADYYLDRYACYLIAMNGDTPETSIAQSYFIVQTRRQEIFDSLTAAEKRIQLRNRVRDANKKLNDAAKDAGVQQYAFFHAAGYKGLYEMGMADIKTKKGLSPKEDLLDRMGRSELAMNEFRITQTEDKLVRDGVHGEQKAIETHQNVGREVRNTVKKLGGTMPEDLLPEPSIKELENQNDKSLEGVHKGKLPTKTST
ncbi:MAG: DNA damage-inducible protein D [Syntrophorhabdales bacterium]